MGASLIARSHSSYSLQHVWFLLLWFSSLLALQLGADLGYLLYYYRASRGICLGDISSNEVGCLLQIEGEILQTLAIGPWGFWEQARHTSVVSRAAWISFESTESNPSSF